MEQVYKSTPQQNVISFEFLRHALWSQRLLIIGLTIAGLAIGILLANYTGAQYQVTMTVIPAETDADRNNGIQLTSLLSSGNDVPVSRFKQFQSELFSYRTADFLNRRYGTLCAINPTRCDMATRTWLPKPAWRRRASLIISTLIGKPPSPDTPQILDLVAYLKRKIEITTDRASSLTTISITTQNPEQGKKLLEQLASAANQSIRTRDRSDIQEYVDYISRKLQNLTAVDQRSALDSLLLTEERRLMLTEVQVAYAATTLDGPNAVAISGITKIGFATLSGLVLGMLIAIALRFLYGTVSIEETRGRTFRNSTAM